MSRFSRMISHLKQCLTREGSRRVARTTKRQVRLGGMKLGSVQDLFEATRDSPDEKNGADGAGRVGRDNSRSHGSR